MLNTLKEISNNESWDYEKSYNEKYRQFLNENYKLFSISEIISLSEKFRMNIPISAMLSKCENNYAEKELFLDSIKEFIIVLSMICCLSPYAIRQPRK